MTKKVFSSNLEQLHNMLSFVGEFCNGIGCDPSVASKIVLATEEVLVNIIIHGYSSNQEGLIELLCEQEKDPFPGITILIKDNGIPFNPLEINGMGEKQVTDPLTDELVGGYGIFLYFQIMDRVEYRRIGENNILCLTKYFF